MNIGIVTTWFASGGGNVSKNYVRALEKKHQVFIYARGGLARKGDPEWDGPNVTWAPPHPCSTGIYASHFAHWVRQYSIEAVLFNEQRYWSSVVAARKLGILIGAYVDYYTADTVPFFDLYDFLICNTRRHYSVFQQHPQCCYCPWGTAIDVYKPTEKARDATRPTTFLVSAGWTGEHAKSLPWLDRRGAGMALRVFRQVQENCRLIILSQVPLEKCPSEWQMAVRDDARIEFRVGTFEPTPYTDGDVYVYPSRLDGIGLTLPEALSCGLPAITTNAAPMNEFVCNGYNGILVDVKEYRGRPDGYYWPEAICDESRLLEAFLFYVRNPLQVRIHGANARAFAEKYLSWEKNASFLVDWIPAQKRLSDRSGVSLERLCVEATRYDRRHSPTPLQKILLGVKSLTWQLTHRFLG